MTAPRLPVAFAATTGTIIAAGQFVVPAAAATPNTQVLPALLPAGNAGTSQLTPTQTQSPMGSLLPVFCSPNAAVAQPPANLNALPRGVVTSPQLVGSEFLVDLSTIQSDIVSANCAVLAASRGTVNYDIVVSAIDNVNKLVYLQTVSFTTGAPVAAVPGTIITFQVWMKDATGI